MFGIEDPAVSAAYALCIISALLCTIYGIVNWNRGNNDEEEQIREELAWQQEETNIEGNM